MKKIKPFECDLKTYEGYIRRKEYWDDMSAEWNFSSKEEKIIHLSGFVQQGGSLLRMLNRYAKDHDEIYRQRIQYCILSYLRMLVSGGFSDDSPICKRIKCLDKKELVLFLKEELKHRVLKTFELDVNGNVKEYWVIETNSLNANGKYISDDVLLDRIQIPYWRAHPEESMAAYERRAVIHWDVTKGNSLW
jgi:hypothetical protein